MNNNCINFRDVGEFVNLLADKKLLKEKTLYRRGKISEIANLSQIESPKKIINLRRGKDPLFADIEMHQIATENQLDVYNTTHHKTQRWLNDIMYCLQDTPINLPVFIHCASGKDRTGVAIAALLTVLDIHHDIIIEEYLLSDGLVKRVWVERALEGLANPAKYFNKVSMVQIKKNFLSNLL